MICGHEAQVEMIRAVAERLPLVVLWQLDLEPDEDVPGCAGPDLVLNATREGLTDEDSCDEDPTWKVALPVENEGVFELPLCPRHLALLLLNRDGNVT